MDTGLWADALGALLLGLGVFFGLRFKKRRFDRTNHSGIEVFRSYWSMIGAKFKDASLCLLSLLFTLTGVLLIAFNHFDSWGWVVVFPALIFGVFLPLGSWRNKRP